MFPVIISAMRIYSRTGDRGTTSLFGGKRVDKDNLRIEAYGNVDELNSLIGAVLAENPLPDLSKKLERIQAELFVLGADLSTPLDIKVKVPRMSKTFISRLEKEIDIWQKSLPALKKFILPGGSKIGAILHLARTVARRAERSIAVLSKGEKINNYARTYINRLSDWFFVAARYVNKIDNVKEKTWKGRG